MAIKKATAFTASDGSMHATVEGAQGHELVLLYVSQLPPSNTGEQEAANKELAMTFANVVMQNTSAILDILTTGPRSRPGARKVKGTTAPRRAADKAAVKAGFKAMRQAVEAGTSTLSGEALDKAERAAGVDRDADNARDMAAERLRQIPMEAAEG